MAEKQNSYVYSLIAYLQSIRQERFEWYGVLKGLIN